MDAIAFDEVERLEAELLQALSMQHGLEEEIRDIIQVKRLGIETEIGSLPTELLVDIFQLVLEQNSCHIGRLRLVCRTWNQIIHTTPQLWSAIHITIPIETVKVAQITTYCSKCVELSGERPLDISIDYSALETSSKATEQEVEATLRRISGDMRFIGGFKYKIESTSNARYQFYIEHYLGPLRSLSGENNSTMLRWRSFELRCGALVHFLSVIEAATLTEVFRGSTPSLKRLDIYHSSIYLDHGIELHSILCRDYKIFPDAPSLRTLSLSNISAKIDVNSIDPLKLKQMKLHCYRIDQFWFTLRCKYLTTLHLGFSYTTAGAITRTPAPSTPLQFPHLERLELGIRLPDWFFPMIDAPVLTSIAFVMYDAFLGIVGMSIPAPTTTVEMRYPEPYLFSLVVETRISSVFRSPSVTTLICAQRWKADVQKQLQLLRLGGLRSPSLSTLLVVPSIYSPESAALERIDLTLLFQI